MLSGRYYPLAALLALLTGLLLPAGAAAMEDGAEASPWPQGQEWVVAQELRVTISGVTGAALDNVRAALAPPVGLVREGRVNELWLRRYVGQLPARAAEALEPFGYYEAHIEVSTLHPEGQLPQLLVQITPGEPVRVSALELRLEGHRQPELVSRLEGFPLRVGDVLRHDLYEGAKAELRALAVALGYLDARFSEHVIRVDRAARAAAITLVFTTGERYYFGEFSLLGAERYPRQFLERYRAARPGEVFSYERLGQTQRNFLDSDRFRSVTVQPRRDLAEAQQVPVEVLLDPLPERRLRPGIGYGTDTGARLSTNYRDFNARRRGHELSLNLLLAELVQDVSAYYILPSHRNMDSQLVLRTGYRQEDLDTYETAYGYGEVERVYGLARGRRGSLYLRYQQERSTFTGSSVRADFLMPGARYTQVRYDDQIRPTKGYRYDLEARGSWSGLLSDITLGQLLVDASLLRPLPGRLSVLLRVGGGTTLQQDPIEDIPASLRFFAGGDRSVRGYAYQSLGPTDADGNVVGGKHLLVASIELERALGKNWGLALFMDGGNAFNQFNSIHEVYGAGFGVRYFTPVGAIRVDLARQLSEDQNSWRLHLGIGLGW